MLKFLARLNLVISLILSANLIFYFKINNVEGTIQNSGLRNKIMNTKVNILGRDINNVDDSLFVRSRIDNSEYKFLRLSNKMNVFLVSNKSFTKSVITLSMKIGSVHDPEDLPGFVNFVQKTLCFISNNKDDLSKLCSYFESVNGIINIEVLDRNTIFTIEIDNLHIMNALNILSNSIKNPVFSENLLYTEIERTIESLNILKKDEEYVFQCVRRDISIYDSVFKRQKVITNESIKEAEVNSGFKLFDRIKKFQKKYYSSNIMTIAISSKESIEKLTKGVTSGFSSLKDLKLRNILPQDLFKVVRHPHIGNIGSVIRLQSNISNELILEFPVEYQEVLWDSSPGKYLEYLLNDNSEYSLMNYLITRDLIKTMNSKVVSDNYGFSNFEISFVLTESGVDRIKTILQVTFILIEHIKSSPIFKDIIAEIHETMKNTFDYYFEVSPEYINRQIIYSFDTRGCSPEEVLIAGNLIRNSNLTEIKRFMNKISLNNIIIYLKHLDKIKDVFNSKDLGVISNLLDSEDIISTDNSCIDSDGGNKQNNWEDHIYNSSYEASSISTSSLEFIDASVDMNEIENNIFNGIKYYIDSIPKDIIREIKMGIDKIKLNDIGIRVRRANKLLKKVYLSNFKDTANYRIYSPIYLKNALLDFFSGEMFTLPNNIDLDENEILNNPVFSSIVFSNNVNFKRQTSRVFLRYMIPRKTENIPILNTILNSSQLVLTLEVLVHCLKYVSSRVIGEMSDLSGLFLIRTNIASEFTGVPFGFEIIVKGDYFGSVYIAIKEFKKKMNSLGKLITQNKYNTIIKGLEFESKARIEMGSKSSSKFILKSIFECQKLSKYVLETVDYSNVTFEQVLELSSYIGKYGTNEGVIIGNISPLHAYSLVKVISTEYKNEDQTINYLDKSSLKSNLNNSMEIWEILDPFSTNFYHNSFYYYNQLYNLKDNNSNSLLYVPFSTFSLDSFYFKFVLGMLIDLLKGRGLTEGIEFDLYPNIHQFNFVGFYISFTSGKLNVPEMSERLLSVFFKVFNLLKSIDMDQYNNLLANKRSINIKIEPDHEQVEKRLFHSIVCRKDISNILNKIKALNYKLSYEKFVNICNKVLDAPKFLISTQAHINDSQKLVEIENYTPNGFIRLSSIYEITNQDGIKTFKIPINYTTKKA
ncbi:secreted insulinase like peptidase [Cryptosporidium xiaoi]|uniref:Secreted insulinase like peptidase n=1 Tax=Cryptosporidium xiaoi TaxID=659607 RepID=A0AAV9XXF2_9CRYT